MQVVLTLAGVVLLLFLGLLLGTIIGGCAGWAVGLVFPEVIDTLNVLSGQYLSGWTWGAVVGFVGGFFRSVASK